MELYTWRAAICFQVTIKLSGKAHALCELFGREKLPFLLLLFPPSLSLWIMDFVLKEFLRCIKDDKRHTTCYVPLFFNLNYCYNNKIKIAFDVKTKSRSNS